MFIFTLVKVGASDKVSEPNIIISSTKRVSWKYHRHIDERWALRNLSEFCHNHQESNSNESESHWVNIHPRKQVNITFIHWHYCCKTLLKCSPVVVSLLFILPSSMSYKRPMQTIIDICTYYRCTRIQCFGWNTFFSFYHLTWNQIKEFVQVSRHVVPLSNCIICHITSAAHCLAQESVVRTYIRRKVKYITLTLGDTAPSITSDLQKGQYLYWLDPWRHLLSKSINPRICWTEENIGEIIPDYLHLGYMTYKYLQKPQSHWLTNSDIGVGQTLSCITFMEITVKYKCFEGKVHNRSYFTVSTFPEVSLNQHSLQRNCMS